jgi:indolepyruvate ferredoxin oxidoreductase alpha subunit
VYAALRRLHVVINGDIGCYTLGFLPPLSAVHTTGCMGAGIGVAHGVAMAGVEQRNVAVIGDSTFLHSGMPALLNMAYNGGNTVTVILDNGTTAMTGHQDHAGTGRTLRGGIAPDIDLEALVRALGIRDVTTVDPYRVAEMEGTLRSYLALDRPSVIIARRACALLPDARVPRAPMQVDADLCMACGICLGLGCPSISQSREQKARNGRGVARIDERLCAGCTLCLQSCPNHCIAPAGAAP